jgi:hypothetical protein
MSDSKDIIKSKVVSGELGGSASALVLPTVPCSMAWISALTSNAGNVYLGGPGVTIAAGTTDTTSGIELEPGDMIGPIPIDNLNRMYIICDNATDDIAYLTV